MNIISYYKLCNENIHYLLDAHNVTFLCGIQILHINVMEGRSWAVGLH